MNARKRRREVVASEITQLDYHDGASSTYFFFYDQNDLERTKNRLAPSLSVFSYYVVHIPGTFSSHKSLLLHCARLPLYM